MILRKAVEADATILAGNNVLMAKESENVSIDYDLTLSGIKSVLGDLRKGFYLVAEDAGAIVGQLMITYEWSDWRDCNIWWIQSVFIDPEWRRTGVFKELVREIYRLGMLEGVNTFRLYVHRSNVNAIEVYRRIEMVEKDYLVFEYCVDK